MKDAIFDAILITIAIVSTATMLAMVADIIAQEYLTTHWHLILFEVASR